MTDPRLPDAARLAALRDLLPATGAGIYLDTATRGPLPAETAAAMREADEWELRVGGAAAGRMEDAAQRAEEARAVLAALGTAQPDAIALLPSVDVGLAAAAWAPDWRPGDRALLVSGAGSSVHAAVRAVGQRTGVVVDSVEVPAVADGDQPAAAIAGAMTPHTRLIAASLVSPISGAMLELSQVAAVAHEHGAWLVVDASHAMGAVPVALEETGADFVCFATDRWCLGPEGTAAMWIGQRALRDARPILGTASDVAGRTDAAARFEPSPLPRTAMLGLARSVGWLEMYVGLGWAHQRAAALAARLRERLGRTTGVELLTSPAARHGTIVSFRVAGWQAAEVAEELGRRVFAIVRHIPEQNAVRASVGWFNTESELDSFADAVAVVAAHTSATMPRRPALVVVPHPGDRDGGS